MAFLNVDMDIIKPISLNTFNGHQLLHQMGKDNFIHKYNKVSYS
jgi:hypothetical protein